MKTKCVTLFFLFATVRMLADGPNLQVSPFMQSVFDATNGAQAQTDFGFLQTSNVVSLIIIGSTASLAVGPSINVVSNNLNAFSLYCSNHPVLKGGLIANALRTVLYQTNWSTLSAAGWLSVTDGVTPAPYVSSGKIIFSPSDGNLSSFIELTNLPNDDLSYSIQVDCTLLSADTANSILVLGKNSFNPWWNVIMHGWVGPFGLMELANQNYSQSLTDHQFVAAAGNEVILTYQELRDKFSISAFNVQSNYSTIFNYISVATNGLSFYPNSSYFTIWNSGNAALQINAIKITSYQPTNALWAFIGDSVMLGNQAGIFQNSIPATLERWLGSPCDVFAGTGDRTFELTNDLPYILKFHPQNILLRVGYNNIFAGDWDPPSYEYFVSTCASNGITVFNLASCQDTNNGTLTAFQYTTYPANFISVVGYNTNTMVSSDGSHPNAFGYLFHCMQVAAKLPQFSHQSPYDRQQLDKFRIGFLTNQPSDMRVISAEP